MLVIEASINCLIFYAIKVPWKHMSWKNKNLKIYKIIKIVIIIKNCTNSH